MKINIIPDNESDKDCASQLEKVVNFLDKKVHDLCVKDGLIIYTNEYFEAYNKYMKELIEKDYSKDD